MRILKVILLISLLPGCDCQEELFTLTRFHSSLDHSIEIEFRYYNGASANGRDEYTYFRETIGRNDSSVDIHSDSVDVGFAYLCVIDGNGRVARDQAKVQFNLSTLSQFTLCDASGFFNQFGGPLPRYYVRPIHSDCGDFRKINISEGY